MGLIRLQRCIMLIWVLMLTGVNISSTAAQASPAMVDMESNGAEIRDVLSALAAVAGMNIIVDDSVTGKISLSMHNTPFPTALELITRSKGLAYQQIDKTIIVAAPEKLQQSQLTQTYVLRLRYAAPATMRKNLSMLVGEGRLREDPDNHMLLFTGTKAEYDRICGVVAELDIPQAQVMLEAQIVEISGQALKELGVNWQWSTIPAPQDSPLQGTIHIGPAEKDQVTFAATLDLLVTKGQARILAKPHIAAIDRQTARILIGDRIPVETKEVANGLQTVSVQYIEAGVKLEITPHINGDGYITTRIKPEVSTIADIDKATGNPRISTREAETMLRVKNGDTIIIGGLLKNEQIRRVDKLPGLGDLPLIGQVFRHTYVQQNQTEIVIMVTPRII